jgi:hypothetical protein
MKMKKTKMIKSVVISLVILVFLSVISFADITIVKKTDKSNYNLGENIKVLYEITNPFPNDIDVILTNKNIINDNYGYDLQCLRFKIPANGKGILDLEQSEIKINFYAIEEGTHTLESAKLLFHNPDLDIVDEVVSNTVSFEIKDSDYDVSSIPREIEVINLCSEEEQQQQQQQQEQKENQPSKEETQQKKQQEQEKLEQQQKEMQDQYNQQSQTQKNLQNAQQSSNQNTRATKEAFEKQRQRNDEQRQQLKQQIENSSEFKEMNENMQNEGFEQTDSNFTAMNNDTGDFNYEYKNPETGEKNQMQGSMDEGEIKELKNSQDIKNNEDYQNMKQKLEQQGFKEQDKFNMNKESFSSEFHNPQTGEKRDVTGEYDKHKIENIKSEYRSNKELIEKIMNNNNTNNQILKDKLNEIYNNSIPEDAMQITQHPNSPAQINSIKNQTTLKEPIKFNETTGELLEKPNFEEDKKWKKWLIIFIGLSLLVVSGLVYWYRKKKAEELLNKNVGMPVKKPVNYKKEALKFLKQAEEQYESGNKKKGYELASYAVRFFNSYKLGYACEITAYKLVNILKEKGLEYEVLQETFNLCALVEFAKYTPNKKDFNLIIKNAKEIIIK